MSADTPNTAALEAAADWVDRLAELSAEEQRALREWRAASEENARAFALMRGVMQDPALIEATRQAAGAPAATRPHADARRRAGRLRRPPMRWPAIAAGAAIAAAAAGLFIIAGLRPPASETAAESIARRDYATPIGVRADASLSDRSVLHLDADSKVQVAFSRTAREVRLERGEAMFEVAHEPARPFDVSAGGATVTAVGTVFDVNLIGDAVEVRVFRGAVRVAAPNGGVRLLRAGEWLTLDGRREPVAGRFLPDLARTWRANWLQADRMPLADVVARLNRYSSRPIVLKSRDLDGVPISGRFELNRPEATLSMLSALLELEISRGPKETSLSRKGRES